MSADATSTENKELLGVPPHSTGSAASRLTRERLQQLYNQYLSLIRLEVEEFGVKATEVRHLIGRLGEFHCALELGGQLAQTANQHGFDVECGSGRRVSVKTTAQKGGFVSVGQSTLAKVQDLMVVHYSGGALSTLYYGPVDHALRNCRTYQGRFELDIPRARRLMAELKEMSMIVHRL